MSIALYLIYLKVIENLTSVESKVIADAGHSIPWTHSDELMKEINNFLDNE